MLKRIVNIFINRIEFDTYSDNDDYIVIFSVPKKWAINWIVENFQMTLSKFNNFYTWDNTEQMYYDAINEKQVIHKRLEANSL